jgi:2-polyprenyl-3-methyl-5-hydroxy-6-metoxy-1,4-benzoquinol methylase
VEKNPLKIVAAENFPEEKKKRQIEAYREQTQAKLERLWLLQPEKFDPTRSFAQTERLERTWQLLLEFFDPKGKKVVDLGCGMGFFSDKLFQAQAQVDAVDVAANALKQVKVRFPSLIHLYHDYVPKTTLNDAAYDLVCAMDIIAYMHPNEFRLFFSELARLVKTDGYVICSTPLDIRTEDPLASFMELAQTELVIDKCVPSYHRLLIQLLNFFEAPCFYAKCAKDAAYKVQEQHHYKGYSLHWFKYNTTRYAYPFWKVVSYLFNPIASLIKHSKKTTNLLEKLSRFIWDDAGISHAIFIGHRKPLFVEKPAELPIERKTKRQVWE